MTIGNGGGVELTLDGEALGVPGAVGKVVRVKLPKDAKLLRVPAPDKEVDKDNEEKEPSAPATTEGDGFGE